MLVPIAVAAENISHSNKKRVALVEMHVTYVNNQIVHNCNLFLCNRCCM